MTKIEAEILRDAALRPTTIKTKRLKVDYEFYPSGAVSKIILSGRRASIPRLFDVLNMIYPRDVTVSIRGSAWHDRNPKTVVEGYVGDLAPHSATNRVTYTVPAGKKAMIELLQCKVYRITAATTPGILRNYWLLTPEGGVAEAILDARIRTNNVGDSDRSGIASTVMLLEGDKIKSFTGDSSTAGTATHNTFLKATEFDA